MHEPRHVLAADETMFIQRIVTLTCADRDTLRNTAILHRHSEYVMWQATRWVQASQFVALPLCLSPMGVRVVKYVKCAAPN